ncbi:hypothetical protein [Gorillibacterium sp. CAU 1737]|uniref:hypothetical protein n=1 Tax=Gorillibacterium sp. CAU 1737 TaxID=3140362 RepID=UPI0032606735
MLNRKKLVSMLAVVLGVLVVLSGCGGKEKSDEEKIKEALANSIAESLNQGTDSKQGEKDSVESKLHDISNYVTGEIWNDGFVNVGWYAGSGNDSTGEKLDFNFMMERLGKSVEKKAEYTAYIEGLDAKYDDLKKVWSKLSSEIDTLYKQLQDNPPKADDENYTFETGAFKQYQEAFKDDVDALTAT